MDRPERGDDPRVPYLRSLYDIANDHTDPEYKAARAASRVIIALQQHGLLRATTPDLIAGLKLVAGAIAAMISFANKEGG